MGKQQFYFEHVNYDICYITKYIFQVASWYTQAWKSMRRLDEDKMGNNRCKEMDIQFLRQEERYQD